MLCSAASRCNAQRLLALRLQRVHQLPQQQAHTAVARVAELLAGSQRPLVITGAGRVEPANPLERRGSSSTHLKIGVLPTAIGSSVLGTIPGT